MGTAEQVAQATAFLCSTEAAYMTGSVLLVDGAIQDRTTAAAGRVSEVEFRGAFCHVTVALAGAEDQPLIVSLSRRRSDEMNIAEGASLAIGLRPDCLRLLS